MLGPCTVDKCAPSPDGQCYKDCCHLEGDTPIEIRIAYQPPRQAAPALGPSHLAGLHPNLGQASVGGFGGGFYQAGHGGYEDPFDGRFMWAPHVGGVPRSAEGNTRHRGDLAKPTVLSTRWSQRATPAQEKDDFDPAAFAAPSDSDHDKLSPMASSWPRKASIRSHSLREGDEFDFFPEVVRLPREGSDTCRGACSGLSAVCGAHTPGRAGPVFETPKGKQLLNLNSGADDSAGVPARIAPEVTESDCNYASVATSTPTDSAHASLTSSSGTPAASIE